MLGFIIIDFYYCMIFTILQFFIIIALLLYYRFYYYSIFTIVYSKNIPLQSQFSSSNFKIIRTSSREDMNAAKHKINPLIFS